MNDAQMNRPSEGEVGEIVDGAEGQPSLFRPPPGFGEAEWVAECIMESIWGEVKVLAHDRGIKAKRFGFAAQAASKIMLSDLSICFSYIEPTPPVSGEGWDCEPQVPLPVIDNWAPQAIRVLPKKSGIAVSTATGVSGKLAQHKAAAQRRVAAKAGGPGGDATEEKPRHVRLEENVEADPEEAHYRNAKEVEEQRRLDAVAAKEARRKQIEAAAANVEAQVATTGHFTFDTEGKILLVELPKVEKLPQVSTQALSKVYDISRKTEQQLTPQSSPNKLKATKLNKKGPQFEDGYTRLQEDRPPITDVINLRPGVVLSEAGRKISGPQLREKNMTLANYKKMVDAEKPYQFIP
ncbi:unnamed protein product [Amoebophrya sp. A120]|nr:unnamed protein product [Amoebophrya sp. A120]|eukprot:GSA120T00015183001.1